MPSRGAAVRPLDYHAVRMLRFRFALVDFLRRWGIYCAIAVLLVGAGSNAPFAVAAAMAAQCASPLRAAAGHGWWIVPAVLAYAAAGALPVVASRPLWWPRGWAQAERALPIEPAAIRRSDRIFSWIIAGPWQVVLLVGVVALRTDGTAAAAGWIAVGADAVSAIIAQQLALLWMRRVRRAGRSPSATARIVGRREDARPFIPVGPLRALVWLPLARGRAARSTTALVVGSVATLCTATAVLWWGIPTGWSLAALSLVALAATSALRPCTTRELQPGWRVHRALPLPTRTCEAARIGVVLAPALVGIVVACAVIASHPGNARFGVLAAHAAILLVGCAIEAKTRETMQPSHHAARWILTLSVAIAFGSEVSPS